MVLQHGLEFFDAHAVEVEAVERVVDRCEDGERAGAVEGIYETGALHRGDEHRELGLCHRVGDDGGVRLRSLERELALDVRAAVVGGDAVCGHRARAHAGAERQGEKEEKRGAHGAKRWVSFVNPTAPHVGSSDV